MSNEKSSSPDLDSKIADAIGKALEKALPIMAAVTQPQRPAIQDRTTCPDCRQYRTACKGEHVQMVVFAKDPEVARWFQGLKINGVTYLSSHAGHYLTVPKQNDFASLLTSFEQGEKEMLRGKQREHNSGALGGAGGHFIPATGFR